MRGVLTVLISVAAFASSVAVAAVRADAAPEAARGASARHVPSSRPGQPTPGPSRPGATGGAPSTALRATTRAHDALRERMLQLTHRPASTAAVAARSGADVRSVNRTGPVAGIGTRSAYHPMPGRGALGGPTSSRSAVKGLSGVQRRPL
jgi:hypothetical protein